ncbi:MAG TPA: molybdenum cofactor biosynthesis protein MoaE [Sphingorhabdus sp.]|jgi:molybdopterin synthase catalytic subunit|nr:molybdenum cofactor biosynthesis protein MoaE [Sphingorhabdus sp.]
MKIVRIGCDAIDGAIELAPLAALGGGAVASFTGIARDDANDGGGVTAIELEHYPAMTQASLESLANEAIARWRLLGCVVVHRVGMIAVGEAIVLVGTAASHRAEALDACTFLIDRLKTDAPFWKKEHRVDGSADWVEAKNTDDARAEKWRG